MTIQEAITEIDLVKPALNFTDAQKVRWLEELDGRIWTGVYLMEERGAPKYSAEHKEVELLLPRSYDMIYINFLAAQIDLYNGEYAKYATTKAVFDKDFGDFCCWFANTYNPAQGYVEEGHCCV